MDTGSTFQIPKNLKWFFLAGVLLAILAVQILSRQKNPFPALVPGLRASVAVLYFEPAEGSGFAGASLLGDSLTVHMAARLRTTTGPRIVGPDSLAAARRRLGAAPLGSVDAPTALKLAAETGCNRILVGSFGLISGSVTASDSVTASVRLVDVSTGRLLATESAAGLPARGLEPLVDSLAARLLRGSGGLR